MSDQFGRETRKVEQVCYFDGIRCGDQAVMTTITFPNAELHATHFHVSPESMSQAGQHFRALGIVRLAQVHTHPDAWTGHSPWDDSHAYSQMPGAISIVLQHFGRIRPALNDAGLHLRTAHCWTEIASEQTAEFNGEPLVTYRERRGGSARTGAGVGALIPMKLGSPSLSSLPTGE